MAEIYQTIEAADHEDAYLHRQSITACANCGEWIIVTHKKKQCCLECQARNCALSMKNFKRFYRSAQWRKMRQEVFKIKGRICAYCGKEATCVDHATPISRGGTNDIENLQPACAVCNVRKINKTHDEYLQFLKNHCYSQYGEPVLIPHSIS